FDPSKFDAGPMLRRCVRHAGIDHYRLRHFTKECPSGDLVIAQAADKVAAAKPVSAVSEVPSERFFWLLEKSMGREGGPVHERLTFGFNRVVDTRPRELV